MNKLSRDEKAVIEIAHTMAQIYSYKITDDKNKMMNTRNKLIKTIINYLSVRKELQSLVISNDLNDFNIGMVAAYYGIEEVVVFLSDNENTLLQQDRYGLNMGMYAAKSKLKIATAKAKENAEACKQKDIHGKSIFDYESENTICPIIQVVTITPLEDSIKNKKVK